MIEKTDLSGPLGFLAYGLLLLALAAFLFIISPVRIDRLGGVSARQELEADGVIAPADSADTLREPEAAARNAVGGGQDTDSAEAESWRESADLDGSSGDNQQGNGRSPGDKSGYGFEPSARADAVELCRLWMKDTPLFEETYGAGRLMGVSGTILELREFGGDYIITLDGAGPQFKTGKVECYFDPDQMLPLKALRSGDAISIVGQCGGGVKGPILQHSRLEGRL